MDKEKDFLNNNGARYVAAQIEQNRYNKNRGLTYETAVSENYRIKADIDRWLEYIRGKAPRKEIYEN